MSAFFYLLLSTLVTNTYKITKIFGDLCFYGCDDPAPETGRLFPLIGETGADEQATKPAVVGCFRCLLLFYNMY